jgi:hypothetical protein
MAYLGGRLLDLGLGFPARAGGGYFGGIVEEVARPGDGGRCAERAGEFGDGGCKSR